MADHYSPFDIRILAQGPCPTFWTPLRFHMTLELHTHGNPLARQDCLAKRAAPVYIPIRGAFVKDEMSLLNHRVA